MQGSSEVAVLRLGHRPGRDDRMTTHVGLTARALGADRVVLPEEASGPADTIRDITGRFGGPFEVEVREDWRPVIRDWPGVVVHLTMYGLPVQAVEADVRADHRDGPVLVVLGAEKVPFEVYDRADYNVGVTNQPHSEIAGLAVFLDRLFEGRELDREWEDADRRVVPKGTGKQVVPLDEEGGDEAGGTE
ncbi:tRNA (cytidine(56)-2'-O)-methyltransferase [Haloglomus irregulare]|jgi:tRNA (cytidine56-2'-O)-methyltransferase|uniref:tRNA (cytidine(56)-2'-O)-methyltransferase n=1 Tax=Haloglomus irregulare TaxID=2234134 RepID=A0A554N8M1_9EURY|nr:tRNA (cytidine(56)-2'-O)-methyltransferase [Haloglomus irregulare]TSD13746.1 tRNA (cytidine(56)-2'-O)-methyltransferase [Haloglomus irregulare]